MEGVDAERKLAQHLLQNRFQIDFGDARHGSHDLPLRDFIDGVDVIDAFGLGRVAPVDGIQKSAPPFRLILYWKRV